MNYIDGSWRASVSGRVLNYFNPATGEIIGEIADSVPDDIDHAVKAARAAFESGCWSGLTAIERGRVLHRISELVLLNKEELAGIEAADIGKPIANARNDMVALARYFEYYAGAADKFFGDVLPYMKGHAVTVEHLPHGVTGHILPWNYPAQMFGRSIAPALAMGNCIVLKPAEDGCASILRLAELAREAGLPAGVLNIVTGRGEVVGAALASHPDVNFISFTGSPRVGQLVQKMAADHFAGCTLELGGKSPNIVFADADLAKAVPVICRSLIQNAGQTCAAGSRVLIQRSIWPEAIAALREAFSALRAGVPEADADCGPIITRRQYEAVSGFIERALADPQVRLLTRGSICEGTPAAGNFIEPAFFETEDRSSELAREEVFGPVLVALPFEDEADAIRLANDTDYGLVAAVWTADGGRQRRVASQLRCGQVFVNCYGAGAGIELPFGGIGKSGHGREKGMAALHDFSVTRTTVVSYE